MGPPRKSEESTWRESEGEADRVVAIVTYVLCYDDLLAERRRAFVTTLDVPLELGRGDVDAPRLDEAGSRLDLPDRWASSRHAKVEHTGMDRLGPTHLIVDLGSSNGTFVNGVRVQGKHRLVDGDLIEVGHSLLVYRLVAERYAATALGPAPRLGPTTTICPETVELAHQLARVARTTEPVLVLGETGTGKEVVARMVHAESGRAGPFAAVDCGAVPDSLFEATFFGHRRGAFTGATESRVGAITRADGGTLFLDEVGNLSPSAQAKLLRVVEDAAVTPLGSSETARVDVRWIAATNAEVLDQAAPFRRDLLHRLAGFVAVLPPLRKRREDLGVLTAHSLREAGVARASISASAARALFSSPLLGNARELRATLRRAAGLAGGAPIEMRHLGVLSTAAEEPQAPEPSERPIDAAAVTLALERTKGNIVRAAGELGIHPRQLYRYVARFEIDLARLRGG